MRWKLDGVLLDAAVDEVVLTQAHELTAIARDARGATITRTQAIACE